MTNDPQNNFDEIVDIDNNREIRNLIKRASKEIFSLDDKAYYQRAEDTAMRYLKGEPGTSEELVNLFEGFLVRYYQILAHGKADPKDSKTRLFLSLNIRNPQIRCAYLNGKRNVVFTETIRLANLLSFRMARYEPTEIWNTVVMVFLELASQYKPFDKKPRFHNFISKIYYKTLSTEVRAMSNGPIIQYDPPELDDMPADEKKPDPHESDWIKGDCDPDGVFAYLSELERQVLIWRYVDKFTLFDIAEKLGISKKNATSFVRELVERVETIHKVYIPILEKEEIGEL